MDPTKWDATSLQPNTVSIISGIDRNWGNDCSENNLLKFLYLNNYNKVDYVVQFTNFCTRLHDDYSYIGPKIHMEYDIEHLRHIIAFQRKNTEQRALLVFQHCMCSTCVWQNITLRTLFTCRQKLRITIIVFTGSLIYLDAYLRTHADYICTLFDAAHTRQDTRFLPQQPYRDALVRFPSRLLRQEVPNALLWYCKLTVTFQWIGPPNKLLVENTTAPDVQISPALYHFLVRYEFKQSLTTNPVWIIPSNLKRFVNNWFHFAVRRLYAWLLVRGDCTAQEFGAMFQLQGFFEENPGLLKYIGTKLLLFC